MACVCLKISNFPENLSVAEKTELIKHFGATQINCVGLKKPIFFATFENESSTVSALKRLHQLEILGSKLVAVYSKNKSDDWTEVPGDEESGRNRIHEVDSQKCYENFLHNLNAWSLPMDLSQPPPSHLLYLYPPPTMDVIANIARALVAIPKFYNQVLHLMNKMNLLSPFHSSSPQFQTALSSLFGEKSSLAANDNSTQMQSATEEISQKSTSESELESDPEPEIGIPNYIPMKRKAPEKRAGVKRPKLIKVQKNDEKLLKASVSMADVFEVRSKEPQKNITLKLSARPDAEEETPSESVSGEGFGVLFPVVPESTEADVPIDVEVEDESYISMSKIRGNRISERDQGLLPVYKNYQPGAPSSRLYIKNLAKVTTARELHYIFRAFLGHKPTDEEDNKIFDLLHMTEGRMKGQAFVTFPTVTQAQRALREANGYILNDKPMVIQFGRSKVQTVSNAI